MHYAVSIHSSSLSRYAESFEWKKRTHFSPIKHKISVSEQFWTVWMPVYISDCLFDRTHSKVLPNVLYSRLGMDFWTLDLLVLVFPVYDPFLNLLKPFVLFPP